MGITGGFDMTMDLTNEHVDAPAAKQNKHGCYADKACTDATCMELPAKKTCGDCVHEYRCCLMFGHTPTDTYCDWFPRRFREKVPSTN